MVLRALHLAVLMVIPFENALAQRAVTDSSQVPAIVRMETQFFRAWRDAWRDTLNKILPVSRFSSDNEERGALKKSDPTAYGLKYYHMRCPTTAGTELSIIRSAANGPGSCPSWANVRTAPNAATASTGVPVDPAVRVVLRGPLLAQLNALVAALDAAGRAHPDNAWVTGQRVRFRLAVRDPEGALSVARTCTADRWWCSALAGLVLFQQGNIPAADSAFQAATAATSGDARCDWTSIGMLLGEWKGEFNEVGFKAALDMKPRAAYNKMSCAQRDSISRVVFWLANPFWTYSFNERRAEHYARRVSIYLHSAVAEDELHNWEPRFGGDALAEMVMRYGWPVRLDWGGKENDELTAAELAGRGQHSRPSTPYLAHEYDQRGTRVFIPNWTTLLDPFHARDADLDARKTANYPFSAEFIRTRAIASITAQQPVLLRRENDVLFAYAADLSAVALPRTTEIQDTIVPNLGDSVVALVFRATSPDAMTRLAAQRVDAQSRFTFSASIPSIPAIISVEIPNRADRLAVRGRFPIAPPPTLAQMSPGDVAVSDPVILLSPRDNHPLPNAPDSALGKMSGTTKFPRGTQSIGVYWETYGIAPGDSVEIAMRVQRHTPQNALARAAIALNMRGDRNAPVSVAWTEPQPGHSAHVTSGRIPIISRSIILDISKLSPGDYWLDVGVMKGGQKQPVIGRGSFVVQ